MDKVSNSTVSKQKPLENSSAKLFSQVNLQLSIALQAIKTKNSQSLHYAFLNMGIALGIDKAITEIVKSYTKHALAPQDFERDLKNTRLIFHKDWNHLEALVADIPLEEKIDHAREFMRSRQIPPHVVHTLHVPNCTIKCEDHSLVEEVRVDSACQTAEKSTHQKISFRLVKMSNSKKPSHTWDNKGHKDSETRKRALEYESKTSSSKFSPPDSKHFDSTNEKRNKVSSQDSENKTMSRKDSETRAHASEDESKTLSIKCSSPGSKRSGSTKEAGSKVPCQDGRSFGHQQRSGRSMEGSENKKVSRDKNEKTVSKDSDARTHASENKTKTHSVKRSPSDPTDVARSKVSSKKGQSSVHQKRSERTVEMSENNKFTHDKEDKILRKDFDSRKRPRDDHSEPRSNKRPASNSKHLDSANIVQSQISSGDEKRSTKVVDDKKSARKSNDKIVHKGSSDNCRRARGDKSETCSISGSDLKESAQKRETTKSSVSKTNTAVDGKRSSRDSDVTSSGKVAGDFKWKDEVVITKGSSPICKENAQNCSPPECHVTKLVIQNLHPLVNDVDISMLFSEFKSYKSCKVNLYDSSKLLCAADVAFEEETDAMEAKNRFDGKKLDGFPMHIAVVKSEKV